MNRSALLVVSFALLAGCAATTGDSSPTDQGEDEVKSRSAIEISSTNDPQSLPAKLGALMKAFKSDPKLGIVSAIESESLQMSGTDNRIKRTVTCSKSDMELV